MEKLQASPNKKGIIQSQSEARLILVWNRPLDVKQWSDVKQQELFLFIQFVDESNMPIGNPVSKYLLTTILNVQNLNEIMEPSIEHFMLETFSTNELKTDNRNQLRIKKLVIAN